MSCVHRNSASVLPVSFAVTFASIPASSVRHDQRRLAFKVPSRVVPRRLASAQSWYSHARRQEDSPWCRTAHAVGEVTTHPACRKPLGEEFLAHRDLTDEASALDTDDPMRVSDPGSLRMSLYSRAVGIEVRRNRAN